jgi:hypothetical protein
MLHTCTSALGVGRGSATSGVSEGHWGCAVLSDCCHDFLIRVGEAARQLTENAHHYSGPDWLDTYGGEADALKRASKRVADDPFDLDALNELMRLSFAVMRFHDTPPRSPEAGSREQEMKELVRILRQNLDGEDAVVAAVVVSKAMDAGPEAEAASHRLKSMLAKLGKPAYDIVVKIISDIGSATIKKTLGL